MKNTQTNTHKSFERSEFGLLDLEHFVDF